ncbi:MAG: DNA polymerase I, partial [Synergistaceae bacterium]|nr:DNA polymerase I [Synergistaceae bacterium]
MGDIDVKSKKYLLVDGHGMAFRGFYALPPMNAPDGTPTNAVLGFFNMLLKAAEEWNPDGIGLFFDPNGPTARDEMYVKYKEGRKPVPAEFKIQMPLILKLAGLLGYPVFVRDGVEADDMIASSASAIEDTGSQALILSSDKDLLQILRGGMKMARPVKGVSEFKLYDEKVFREEYGFAPSAMADYLALAGDSVDNIPGVRGIGDKTARDLLARYGSLDEIYKARETLPKAAQIRLESGKESAYMSYRLALPLPVEPVGAKALSMGRPEEDEAVALLEQLGLRKLMARLGLDSKSPDPGTQTPTPDIKLEEASSWDGIFSENQLVITMEPDRLITRAGKWKTVTKDDWPSLDKWLSSDGRELVLADYAEHCRNMPFLARHSESIRDTVLAHYFFHPDLGVHPGANGFHEVLNQWDSFASDKLAEDMLSVMRTIDAPLVPVLSKLGDRGLKADIGALLALDAELTSRITEIETEIYMAANGPVNLNSPKQVGELLFERLRLPVLKKTKTGYSTDASVLEELSRLPEPFCEMPRKMLEYRECSKMSSGFVQPFIKHFRAASDGKIHSTFLHTATGTARLASRDPNVQNMPVFGEWAGKFRKTIVPGRDGSMFIAADYSQIELRVLAHLSGEEKLAEAFMNGRDIHLETASWVFGLEPEEITPEQRRFAKTVNFGLIYGMGAHGLAARMGIQRRQAAEIVERYFDALPKVKNYLERSAGEARTAGYTRSIFGRIRPLSEVSTTEGRGGASMDRVAVNTPIQSAAADIAKIAMIRLNDILEDEYPDTRLVLKVH